jgi:radical SAM superfamily enzyme YgiQ (UPF0313 family)
LIGLFAYILFNQAVMKNILFSHSYFLRLDPKQWKTGLPYPPLAPLYAAALMRENGYRVSLFDTMFSSSPDDAKRYIRAGHPDFFVLYDDGFNYLTKMCLTNMRTAAFTMIRAAKEEGCTVIVSSSDSTDHFADYLHEGADFILLGEAEFTLLELTDAIQKGEKDYAAINGIAYKRGNKVTKTAPRSILRELDRLPFAAWDLLDITPYRQSWLSHAGYFSINMATTRGCPFKCNWCAKPIYGNRYNSRSPENVLEEVKMLKKMFKMDHIWFCDDIFGLKPGWVHRFADLCENARIRIPFKIQCRADLLVQENYIRDLARAGCDTVWMGAESGSQKILDAMDKGIRVDQIYTATRLLKKHGIKPSLFIQFGYTGETAADIGMTIRMINALLPHEIGISVSYPLPGTAFYDKVRSELGEKKNWTDSDDLKLMFKNTYPPSFYKKLHRYVHSEYHKHIAIDHFRKAFLPLRLPRLKNLKKALSIGYYIPVTLLWKLKLKAFEIRVPHE